MGRETKEKIIIAVMLCIAVSAFVILTVWLIRNTGSLIKTEILTKTAAARITPTVTETAKIPATETPGSETITKTEITPMSSGGEKLFPTETPVTGMNSPMICKMELIGLHNTAEKVGAAGMLILDTYDSASDICTLRIQMLTPDRNAETVKFIHRRADDNYGITLEITKSDEEQIRLWTKAALLFFNNDISETTASDAAEKVLSEESVSGDLFTLTSSDGIRISGKKVIPVKVIEIISK